MATAADTTAQGVAFDAGLRDHMVRVYNHLMGGLAVSAVSAVAVHGVAVTSVHLDGAKPFGAGRWLTPLGETLYGWPGAIGLLVVAIGLMLAMAMAAGRARLGLSALLYYAFTAAFGVCLAAMAGRHAMGTVVQALAATAAVFGAMSLYGYTTRRDLTGLGAFLFMGLAGLIAVGLANALVFRSGALLTITSAVGVLIFVGYVAYDTQRIKETYSSYLTRAESGCLALWGAMQLYLDVLNIFGDLLNLMGDKPVGDIVSGAGEGVAGAASGTGDAMASAAGAAGDAGGGIFEALGGLLSGLFEGMVHVLGAIVGGVFHVIGAILGAILEAIAGIFGAIFD
jgi:FtsH-binding integral membrane protein